VWDLSTVFVFIFPFSLTSSGVKMAAPAITCTKQQQLRVIKFLLAEDVRVAEFHQRLSAQYGNSVSLQ
jgi:hypothetical protein